MIKVLLQQNETNQNQPKGKMHGVRSGRVPNSIVFSLWSKGALPSHIMCDKIQSTANLGSAPKLWCPEFCWDFII